MDTVLKLLIFTIGFLLGGLTAIIISNLKIKAQKDLLDIRLTHIKKQDDAIRKKQNRVDQLEKEIKNIERRKK